MKRSKKILVISMTTFLVVLIGCSKDETTVNISGTATDIDGNTYKTITIGTQTWMAENLKVTKYPNGEEILLVTVNDTWAYLGLNNTIEAYCYYNNDSSSQYGALYTVEAAKGACPDGWHLPSGEEWRILENYISNKGHNETEGTALKSTNGWDGNGNGTDDYSFSALPGGYRSSFDGLFKSEGDRGHWWCSTAGSSSAMASMRNLYSTQSEFYVSDVPSIFGLSVRCLKDN